jgi:hypothetical protein
LAAAIFAGGLGPACGVTSAKSPYHQRRLSALNTPTNYFTFSGSHMTISGKIASSTM